MQRKSSCRPAFTLTELAMVTVLVGILTVSAWPNRDADDQAKLDSAMTRLAADIEYARSFSVTSPADPAVIKVSMENDKYWIGKQSTPDTPITNPATRKPYIVQLGDAGDGSVRGVNITADNFGTNQMIVFDSSGGIVSDASVGMEFQVGSRKASVKVAPAAASTENVVGDLVSNGVTNVVCDATVAVTTTTDDGGGLLSGLGL